MSQTDKSIFFLMTCSFLFTLAFVLIVFIIHLFYNNVSIIKVTYNYFNKLKKTIEKLNNYK